MSEKPRGGVADLVAILEAPFVGLRAGESAELDTSGQKASEQKRRPPAEAGCSPGRNSSGRKMAKSSQTRACVDFRRGKLEYRMIGPRPG